MQSIAFSVALVPTVANIFCHWAEDKSGDKVVYHMHMIRTFALRDEKQAPSLHRVINNILDWGIEDRKLRMEAILGKIITLTDQAGSKKRKNTSGGGEGEGEGV